MFVLECPQCGERGKVEHYPEGGVCWECLRQGRGRVEVVKVAVVKKVEVARVRKGA